MKYNLRQILLTLLIVFLVFGLVHATLQSYEIVHSSMKDNFYEGQRVLVEKVTYRFTSPSRGDVIVFWPPAEAGSSDPYIKRVIGLPGETVEIRDGEIYITGSDYGGLLKESSNFGSQIPEDESYKYSEITLKEGEYFVLGDNRARSSDSRDWGPVDRDDIVGKVWIRYWPLSDFGLSPGYSYAIVDSV